MATVLFYNFILLSSTFFVWLSEKMRYKLDRWLVLGVAFLLVFVPAAIRYDIGTDYLNYLRIYESGSYINYQFKEPAFYFINWFLDSIGAHFQWLFAVFAFIFTAAAFKTYPIKRGVWIVHFATFCIIYYFSFNGIRQAIAIVFSLWALRFFLDEKLIKFLLFSIIGALFHQSVMLLALVGFLSLIPFSFRIKAYISPLVFICALFLLFFKLEIFLRYLELSLIFLNLDVYANYFNNTRHFVEVKMGTGLGLLSKLAFCFFVLFKTKQIIIYNEKNWVVIIYIFLYAASLILAAQIMIFSRVLILYYAFIPYVLYLLVNLKKNRVLNHIVVFLFCCLLLFDFTRGGFGKVSDYSDPKLNPFQTFIHD